MVDILHIADIGHSAAVHHCIDYIVTLIRRMMI